MEQFTCIIKVTINNGADSFTFADNIRYLRARRQSKLSISLLRVMLIVAKKVMMWSLERITSTFPNLANDQYGWFGTERTEFVFSNDFR